jgi:hypothetical protein
MAADAQTAPMQGPFRSTSAPVMTHPLPTIEHSSEAAELQQPSAPLALDLVELDLALDLSDITDRGFCGAVRDAAQKIDAEFLFDLPASGLIDDAQRIAVVCLSRHNEGRFCLVLLSANGDRVQTVEADEATGGLVQFARAFVSVLEKL